MRPTDFISFIALFLSIFATIFSLVIFVKELHIEEQIKHFHHNNLNITSIIRLDKDIAHLFRTLGMSDNRAERLQINANSSSNSTKGKRTTPKPSRRIFRGNITSKISTPTTRKSFNTSQGQN